MELSQKIELLKKIAIFNQLDESQLKLIAENVTLQTLPPSTIFIEQDTVTTTAYCIIQGAVKVYRITEKGEQIILNTKGVGEVVGEMAILDGKPRSAYVETIQESTFICLTKDNFLKVVTQNPQISINLIGHLVLQIREFNQKLEDILYRNLEDRTYNTLKNLSQYFSNNDITLSQEQLAHIVGATRSRVTESLNQLEKSGKISLSHKKIHLN